MGLILNHMSASAGNDMINVSGSIHLRGGNPIVDGGFISMAQVTFGAAEGAAGLQVPSDRGFLFVATSSADSSKSALYFRGDDQRERDLTGAGLDGSGAATQLAIFSDSDSLTSDSGLSYVQADDHLSVGATALSTTPEVRLLNDGSAAGAGIALHLSGTNGASGLLTDGRLGLSSSYGMAEVGGAKGLSLGAGDAANPTAAVSIGINGSPIVIENASLGMRYKGFQFAADGSDNTIGSASTSDLLTFAADSLVVKGTKSVTVDVIDETTGNAGVTVEGVLLKDNDIVIPDGSTIGSATTADAMTIANDGIVTFKDDIVIKGGGTIGTSDVADAITIVDTSGNVQIKGAKDLLVDEILESTSNAGVTIDGVLLKDNDVVIPDGATIGSVSGPSAITIDASGNVTLAANLQVDGTTTTVNSTTLTVDDKNIELGMVDTPSDTTADGGGITLKGATDKTFNWVNSTDSWTASEHIEVADGKVYRVNGNEVLSQTVLGSTVLASSLTSVGALAGGSIASDFGAINNGASGISSSGLVALAVDADADDFSSDSAVGRLAIGASSDLNLYHGGTNSYIANETGDLRIEVPSSQKLALSVNGTEEAHVDADGLDLAAGNDLKINNTSVLSATVLGAGVVDSSLQNLGAQDATLNMNGNIVQLAADSHESIRASSGTVILKSGDADLLTVDGANSAIFSPATDNTVDLGKSDKRFANIFTGDLNLRNDRGDWTLIEEEDFISFRNNVTGRRFRMVMEDITGTGTYGPGNDGEM